LAPSSNPYGGSLTHADLTSLHQHEKLKFGAP
jgi:hypothetical protein